MPNYRRIFIAGGCWFFTVNLLDRNSRLLVERIDTLRDAVRETRRRFPFEIDAMVVLPEHLHAIWSLPEGDTDFPLRWQQIKIRFSKSIPDGETRTGTQQRRGERGIWQRRYWEHLIRDVQDLAHHIDYCWFNPVKHGLVTDIADWRYSSFHRDHCDPASGMADMKNARDAYAKRVRTAGYGERD